MKALRGGSLAGIAAVVSGSFSVAVLAQDCWVCTSTCTQGEYGPCSGPEMTVCENGASAAQPGQYGYSQLQPQYTQKECKTYSGGTWIHSADCQSSPGDKILPCSTGTPGQCCFWNAYPGGTVTTSHVPVMIQRCQLNSQWCHVPADD